MRQVFIHNIEDYGPLTEGRRAASRLQLTHCAHEG